MNLYFQLSSPLFAVNVCQKYIDFELEFCFILSFHLHFTISLIYTDISTEDELSAMFVCNMQPFYLFLIQNLNLHAAYLYKLIQNRVVYFFEFFGIIITIICMTCGISHYRFLMLYFI